MTKLPQFDPVLAKAELARRHMRDFVEFTKPDYDFNWHHELICDAIDKFIAGSIKRLLIFAPPQHGKSELTTRRLPPKLLGVNPAEKIAVVSYNATLAEGFNRDIQRIIDDPVYHLVYPETVLNESNVVTDVRKGFVRNTRHFETVPHRGSVTTIGVDGTLTGRTVDTLIFDDLYKSRADALSSKRLAMVESFWNSVAVPRLHNNSRILGTFTRWSDRDLGAFLMAKQRGWEVISIPAVKKKEITYYFADVEREDPRPIGGALWPKRHNLTRLKEIEEDAKTEFNALYQQDPKAPDELLIFPDYNEDGKQMIFEIDQLPGMYPRFLGMDFGFSNDPTTLYEMEYDGKANLYVDELMYKTGVGNSEIRTTFNVLQLGKKRCWADSEDPKTIKELQGRGLDMSETMQPGLNIIAAFKGPGSVSRGLQKLRKIKIHITRRSHNLKRERGQYQWVVVAGKPTNDPLQNGNDHGWDAIRYGFEGYTNGAGLKIVK